MERVSFQINGFDYVYTPESRSLVVINHDNEKEEEMDPLFDSGWFEDTSPTPSGSAVPSLPSRSASAPWTSYKSSFPDASSTVSFHVLVDPRALEQNDHVCIRGNLDVFGAWGPGIVMTPEVGNSCIWSAEVTMPFTMLEACPSGMFQFKYTIESGRGNDPIWEGQTNRSEKTLMDNFYHTFRSDYTSQR